VRDVSEFQEGSHRPRQSARARVHSGDAECTVSSGKPESRDHRGSPPPIPRPWRPRVNGPQPFRVTQERASFLVGHDLERHGPPTTFFAASQHEHRYVHITELGMTAEQIIERVTSNAAPAPSSGRNWARPERRRSGRHRRCWKSSRENSAFSISAANRAWMRIDAFTAVLTVRNRRSCLG